MSNGFAFVLPFRFNRLTTYWGPLLAGSDSFRTVLEAVRRSGATFDGEAPPQRREAVTKADLFGLGLAGGTGSAEKRRELLKRLGLPEHLTANGMLVALNLLFSREELEALLAETQAFDKI